MEGWNRGSCGSLSELEFPRCWPSADLVVISRGEEGRICSNRAGGSYRGESGDFGRMTGDICGEVLRERTGDSPLDGAVLEICFGELARMFVMR